MDRRIGIVLLIIALTIAGVAVFGKISSDTVVSELRNETGSCYIGNTCLHEQTNMTFIVLLIAAGVVAIVGAVIIILSFKKTENEEKRLAAMKVPSNLIPEQKKLYKIISEAGGSILQGELVEKSGMNKVTVSRLLDKLEIQAVVERRRHGMSNIVVIKNNYRKS
jgi:uncharacterized membrane protein